MEVVLKKTKITASILKQTLRSTSVDLSVGEIIGWCVFGNSGKYIVCYRSDTKGLSIYPMFKEIQARKLHKDDIEVKVILSGNYLPLLYEFDSENQKDAFIDVLEKAKHAAQVRGQFFI